MEGEDARIILDLDQGNLEGLPLTGISFQPIQASTSFHPLLSSTRTRADLLRKFVEEASRTGATRYRTKAQARKGNQLGQPICVDININQTEDKLRHSSLTPPPPLGRAPVPLVCVLPVVLVRATKHFRSAWKRCLQAGQTVRKKAVRDDGNPTDNHYSRCRASLLAALSLSALPKIYLAPRLSCITGAGE